MTSVIIPDSVTSIDDDVFGYCKKYGLKFGIYYSQDLDWHEENGGGYKTEPVGCAGVSWDNSWDFFGRNAAKAETPVLWPPHAKS